MGLIRTPVATALTVLTSAVALFLLAVFFLIASQLRAALTVQSGAVVMNVFLKDGVAVADRSALTAELQRISGVQSVKFISAAEALTSFQSRIDGQGALLSGFEDQNPLPDSFELTFRPEEGSSAKLAAIRKDLIGRAPVDSVNYSEEVVQKLGLLVAVMQRAGTMGIVIALFVVCFIVASTIQLSLFSHRDEIEVMKLVGATDSYICSPYVIEGAVQGFLGGVLGLVGAYALHRLIHGVLQEIALLQSIMPETVFLSPVQSLLVLGCGLLLGAMGSFIATRSFMRRI
jgi:cell division transport system permease protein